MAAYNLSGNKTLNIESFQQTNAKALDNGILMVYSYNLQFAFDVLRAQYYCHKVIAVDTEFTIRNGAYETRCVASEPEKLFSYYAHNIMHDDLLQIGFTLTDEDGNLAPGVHTFQFNMHYDTSKASDVKADNMFFLLNTPKIDFLALEICGIKQEEFVKEILESEIFANKKLTLVTFAGVMDYYFLIQMLATNKDEPLCKEREMFLKVMHAYFPNSYDVQCMIGDEERNFGATSLTKLAAFHKCTVKGRMQHQAGSDACQTSILFHDIKKKRSETFETDYHGQIFGVGNTNKPEESPKYYFQESRPTQLRAWTKEDAEMATKLNLQQS